MLHTDTRVNIKKRAQLAFLPNSPGVYLFKDGAGEVLYVGKSTNVKERVNSHLVTKDSLGKRVVEQAQTVESIPVSSELEALLLEAALIKKYLPRYNSRAKDDKHPLYIKITIKEEFPKITTSRREDSPDAIFFGPFPSSGTVKQVLRQVRRVFPFCAQKNLGRRACFYSHLGLCNPCPSEIVQITDKKLRTKLKREYRRNIRKIVTLLSGEEDKLQKSLERDMSGLSRKEDFEEAAKARDQLTGLRYITSPYIDAQAYLENPQLLEDIREKEARQLFESLKPHIRIPKVPERIECVDVSHTGGGAATASLVTFLHGEPEKQFYRRFRIRGSGTRDDYAMMEEVIGRRLKHLEDWGIPDLLVVDGGKGQVSAVNKILNREGVDIPVIGLAKRMEEIVIPKSRGFKILRLKRSNPALKILQRLRDEAHRFARAYHFKLRLRELATLTKDTLS